MKHSKGFTLLEVMVALAVFAILASITASAMYYAFDTRARVNQQANQLNELQYTIIMLTRDITQISERSIHGNEMRTFSPFVGLENYLEFTRGGVVNPHATVKRSMFKRVAYQCHSNTLIRRTWDSLDTPNRRRYEDKILLTHLNHCGFSYIDHSHQILPEWHDYAIQQNQKKESIPIAIRLNMTLDHWGTMNLLFAIPEALYATS